MLLARGVALVVLTAVAEVLASSQQHGDKIQRRASWISLGCYTDNVSGRALPNQEFISGGSGAMTNEACQSACLAANYDFAGTEYSGECCKKHEFPTIKI